MPDLNERIALAAERLGVVAAERRHVVVTAESCTGGGIAAAITEVPGSSAWFREGFVTYAAEAKTSLLDVDPKMIEEEGVVSEDVAQAMARGALARCPDSTLAVAVTGVAGPTGGTYHARGHGVHRLGRTRQRAHLHVRAHDPCARQPLDGAQGDRAHGPRGLD